MIRASSKAGRVGRVFEESVNARMLEDYVDVGSRLRGLPQDSLRLLVERFVYGRDVKEIASALGCSPPSIGGRLGQARRALRVALVDLLPKKAHGGSVEEKEPVTLPLDKVAVRRASALRHMRECLDRATGEETA